MNVYVVTDFNDLNMLDFTTTVGGVRIRAVAMHIYPTSIVLEGYVRFGFRKVKVYLDPINDAEFDQLTNMTPKLRDWVKAVRTGTEDEFHQKYRPVC